MPSERHIKLEIPSSNLVNCFGIQPILYNNEMPNRISLFSLNRFTKWKDNATTNNVYYTPKLYTGTDAKIIYSRAVDASLLELYSLNVLLQHALHIKINKSLNDLSNDKNELRNTLLYYSELLKYKNRLNKGNFFITSNKGLFDNIKFAAKQLNHYNKYFISPDYLEENIIIIGAKGCVNFDNPIMAVPFISNKDFYSFLKAKNIELNENLKLSGSGSSWPIMAKMRNRYDKYQLYLNENMPQKWHFETFLYPEMFYLAVHLKN